ncbi:MAG: hypothetical protein ACI310_02735 [Bacilli bacterium]
MKNKIILFLVAVITFTFFNADVKAEKICKIYKDYDLFSEVTSIDKYNEAMNTNSKYNIYTQTQTPAGLSKEAELIKEYQVNIIRTGTVQDKEWTLKDYYNNLKNIKEKGERETLKTSTGDTTILVYSIDENETENGEPVVIRYIKHGKWNAEGKEETENVFTLESLFKSSIDELVSASVIPTGDLEKLEGTGTKIISTKNENGEFYEIQIERTTVPEDIVGLKKDLKAALTNGEEQKVLIAPAVYYREYEYCKETYKAQIDYVYIDGSEAAPSHNEDELEAGYTHEVTSPTIENCTPDKEEVTISIDKDNPKDFYEKVIYTCQTENKEENPKTGSALIFVAWIIGVAAIGYSVYYFTTLKKSQIK